MTLANAKCASDTVRVLLSLPSVSEPMTHAKMFKVVLSSTDTSRPQEEMESCWIITGIRDEEKVRFVLPDPMAVATTLKHRETGQLVKTMMEDLSSGLDLDPKETYLRILSQLNEERQEVWDEDKEQYVSVLCAENVDGDELHDIPTGQDDIKWLFALSDPHTGVDDLPDDDVVEGGSDDEKDSGYGGGI
ncbi:hypothetical protein M231_05017 [Tremella mesenterica]|uniref:Uncharacterized protein n=1 Tax=Tremella mesenterica TaxID=5217 RepID=A0A4Q1BJ31_TREME|nr:hypothetical protein M231_05017 [Tremella mesenterica]